MKKEERALIEKVLLDVAKIEIFAAKKLPDAHVRHSDEYIRRVDTLIEEEKKCRKPIPASRKIAVILVAALLLVALSVATVAFVEPVREFFVEIFDDFINLSIDDRTGKTKIEHNYYMSYLPAGYEKTSSSPSAGVIQTFYSNGERTIVFQQTLINQSESTLDNEDAMYTVHTIDGKTVHSVQKYRTYILTWIDGDYIFTLSSPDSLEWSEIEKMVLGIAPKE